MKPKLKRGDWIRKVKDDSISARPGNLKEAKRVFLKELTLQEQLTLTTEIAACRSSELCKAYKNVIAVISGYGTKRTKKNVRKKRPPCVTFIVRSKWKDPGSLSPEYRNKEELPKYLFAYWSVDGERKLCAVPTDVEPGDQYYKIRPQSNNGVGIESVTFQGRNFTDAGAVACSLKRRIPPKEDFEPELYILSCRHLFSLTEQCHPSNVFADVLKVGFKLAETLSIKGPLTASSQKFSLDAQLAWTTDLELLNTVFESIRFNGDYARYVDDIPENYFIITPHGIKDARKKRFIYGDYTRFGVHYERVGYVVHPLLIESEVWPHTQRGDSGSPVTSDPDGGTFLGMHIAGNGCCGFMIPAFDLIYSGNFEAIDPSEEFVIVNPS